MQNIIYTFRRYLKDAVFLILIVCALGLSLYNFIDTKEIAIEKPIEELKEPIEEEKEDTDINELVYVDIKGAVKKPGVYQASSTAIINDVIKSAGGFLTTAYKNNINLSKKVSNEMVIYVYTKTEYNNITNPKIETCKSPEVNVSNCLQNGSSVIENGSSNTNSNNNPNPDTSISNSKVNINTATVDEFTKLNGIGEAKAKTIIEYRTTIGGFKSVEDLKSVTGIGETLFEKIKDYITI